MTDRPILFSAPMIAALLDGRKSQTRRVLASARVFSTPGSRAFTLKGNNLDRALQGADRWRHLGGDGWYWEADAFDHQAPATRSGWMAHLPYSPGDRLWVREAHALVPSSAYRMSDGVAQAIDPADADMACVYQEGWERCAPRWRPSIHMPRWASRLTLTVTDVRVQRLQDISAADAIAEGCHVYANSATIDCDTPDPRHEYRRIWDSIHGPEAWAANPWVVAVSFEVHRCNIDQMPGGNHE